MSPYFKSLKSIFFFSVPIIAGQLGQMLFGIGDIVVAGHYSTQVLSALGIAAAIFSPFLLIGTGICFGISPMAARMMAQKEETSAMAGTCLILALITGGILSGLIFITGFISPQMGFAPTIGDKVSSYLLITAVSMVPAMVFQVLKELLQAHENTLFANGLVCIFNIFNLGFNILFMFTWKMGINGAALATLLSRSLMAALLFYYARHHLKFSFTFSRPLLKKLYKTGIPIGLNGVLVGAIFSVVTVLAGKMSVVTSAANNILINITSLTYMVPYALGSAASVKIGQALGKKDLKQVNTHALATLSLGLFSASSMGILFYWIPETIVSIATKDPKVIGCGAVLLFYGAIYQIPDAVQTTIQGCLRGMGITFQPMVYACLSIWGLGFPLGCFFAYPQGMEAPGLWLGMAAGLSLLALLNLRLFVKMNIDFKSSSSLPLESGAPPRLAQ